MRRLLVSLGLTAAFAACSGGDQAATVATEQASPCGRSCLEGFIDQYLIALAARDPAGLPLASSVTFVENNQVLDIGDGTWRTVSGLGTYRHYFADPQTGQVAAITVVEEHGVDIIYDLRLRVEGGEISEIEALAVRDPNGAALYEELGTPPTIFLQPVPEEARLSRDELVGVADLYLSGMENNDPNGDYSFFADGCNRLEHARQTTNMPSETYGHSDDTVFVTLSCREQFETGFLGFVTRIRDRRYAVIDEQRQSIFAFAFLDHNGTIRTIDMSDDRVFTVPPYFSVPRTLQVGEAWRIENKELRQIEMTLSEFPYGTRPTFDTGDDWLDPADGPGGAPSVSDAASCDRACLQNVTDRVLQAFASHDPRILPTSSTVRYTENGQTLNLGDGLWGTITALGDYQIFLSDPVTGQAGFYGTIVEHDTPGLLAVRLRMENQAITEIETVVVRQETAGEGGGTLTLFAPRLPGPFDPADHAGLDPALAEAIPPAERSASREMVSIARGPFAGVDGIRDQRVLVADEERGLVLHLAFVDVPNPFDAPASVEIPHFGTIDAPSVSTGPFAVMLTAVSRIENGRLRATDSAARPVPYGMRSGWQ